MQNEVHEITSVKLYYFTHYSCSDLREVPDNQEVFCHKSSDQSIMIDILEYQDQVTQENAPR